MLRELLDFGMSLLGILLDVGRRLLRAIIILAESVIYEGVVFLLTLALCFVVPPWFAPGIWGTLLLFGVFSVLLVLVNIRLLPIQIVLGNTPWSYRASLLRFLFESIAGCVAAVLGVIAHAIIAGIFGVTTLAAGSSSSALLIVGVLVLGVIIGAPGRRFGRITSRFHLLRVTEKMLLRLEAHYHEHLSQLLPTPAGTFAIEVSYTPLDISLDDPTLPARPMRPKRSRRSAQPEMIAFPALTSSLRQPALEQRLTPAEMTHAEICRRFDESRRQLLIFSDVGGGKSTQLYLLANTLLAEAFTQLRSMFESAARGGRHRKVAEMPLLPVIMDLSVLDMNFGAVPSNRISAWHLRDWQREALVKVYGVRRRTAKRWVAKGRITALCDSLDVLPEDILKLDMQTQIDPVHRNDQAFCFSRIRRYLREQPYAPIAVCCSEQTYQAYLYSMSQDYGSVDNTWPDSLAGSPLVLPAVTLQPLAPETVERALRGTSGTNAISSAMRRDPSLATLLRAPMMLSLALAGAAGGDTTAPSEAVPGVVDWRMEICRRYVASVLGRAPAMHAQAEMTLAWLSYQLRERQKLVFHLEDVQYDWVPSPLGQARYDRQISRLRAGFTIAATLLFGIAISGIISVVYSLGDGAAIRATIGTLGTLGTPGTVENPSVGAISRMIFGILGGFGVAQSIGHRITATKSIRLLKHIHPNADVHWRKLTSIASLGMLGLLTAAFIGGPVVVLDGALLIGLLASVVTVLLIAWCGRLATERRHFPPPNRGLFNAIRAALVIMVVYALVGLVVGSGIAIVALALSPGLGAIIDLRLIVAMLLACAGVFALTAAIFAGLSTGFSNGGASVLRHFMLMRALKKSQIVPKKFVRFLDDLRALGLLRREGDGYAFLARGSTLRDYFASDYEMRYRVAQSQRTLPPSRIGHLGARLQRMGQVFAPKRIAQSLGRKPDEPPQSPPQHVHQPEWAPQQEPQPSGRL